MPASRAVPSVPSRSACSMKSFLRGTRGAGLPKRWPPPRQGGASTATFRYDRLTATALQRVDNPGTSVQFHGEVMPHLGVLMGEMDDERHAVRWHRRGHFR